MITVPDELHTARRVQDALTLLVAAIDAAQEDGITVPPCAAQGVANVAVALLIITGQEAQRSGHEDMFLGPQGDALAVGLSPTSP